MTTKIPVELSSTPSIVDNGNATALTIDSSEDITIGGKLNISTGTNGTPTINLSHTNANADNFRITCGVTGVANSGFSIYDVDATANRFVINADGDIGIGVNSPDSKLQIANEDGSTYRFGYGGTSDIYFDADSVRFRTDNGGAGNATIDTDGLKFNNDTAQANALDDYEEGTWTPALTGAYGAAYSTQIGSYIKIGRIIIVNFTMIISTAPTSGSNVYIVLPYTPTGTTTHSFGSPFTRVSLTASQANESAISFNTYGGYANFYPYDRSSGAVYVSYTNWATGQYSWTGTYFTD